MSDFSVYSLASSSKGNSVYVRIFDDEILIDAGISAKRVCDTLKEIGSDITKIKAIFVTHEHSDHVSGLEVLSKKYHIPIHLTQPSADVYLRTGKTPFTAQASVVHPLLFSEQIGRVTVRSFAVSHDSTACVGYDVTDGSDQHTVAIATDLGYISDEVADTLLGIENVVLESNHDENMLLCGPYPYDLKRRILSNKGHLSNEAASSFICRLADSGTKRILLAHLSQDNNLPELAYHSALCVLGKRDITLCVAAPGEPTKLV